MFANEFVLNIGLFLDSTGSTNESINAMHKIGVSVCARTVDLHKTKIALNHKTNIKEFFRKNVNIYNLIIIIKLYQILILLTLFTRVIFYTFLI